tara:strand:+ start:572 stop:1438 length:867 start_codon:yes stop_codon:yes gene_type:complete
MFLCINNYHIYYYYMDKIDLNINNYTLNELLKLFKLSNNLTQEDLKNVKKQVLKTHPDKSGLKPDIFRFFVTAYKFLCYIYSFKYASSDIRDNYDDIIDKNVDMNLLQFAATSSQTNSKFNKIFNELFNESYIKSESESFGYDNLNPTNKTFDSRKKELVTNMVIYHDPEDINSNYNSIAGEQPTTYSSNIFSKFKYEDLKVANDESILSIDETYLKNIKIYNNLNDLKQDRNRQNTTPNHNSEILLLEKKEKDEIISTNRAYNIIKQMNLQEEKNNNTLNKLKYLAY